MPSDDVSEGSKANEATRNENSDWPDSAVYPKLQEQIWPHSTKIRKIEATFTELNPSNENDAQSPSKVSDDVIVPKTFKNNDSNENLSPKGGPVDYSCRREFFSFFLSFLSPTTVF